MTHLAAANRFRYDASQSEGSPVGPRSSRNRVTALFASYFKLFPCGSVGESRRAESLLEEIGSYVDTSGSQLDLPQLLFAS